MTLLDGPGSGDLVRARRRHHLPAGPAELRLHPRSMGSNMAENHPVGFQWVMEAKERGAKLIHVDPRFTRTSAMADLHVPLRAGSDIAFLGGIVHYILENGREFRDYVVPYTNAAVIINEDFADTEDLDGLFSGWDPEVGAYDPTSWQYEGMSSKSARAAARRRPTGAAASSPTAPTAWRSRARRAARDRHRPSSTRAASSSCCKRHFARYTPEMVERACGVPADQLPRGRRGAVRELGPRAHERASPTPSAGPSTRSACSTSAPRRSSSCCWATSGAPAAASSRCAATRRSRARPTSRRSSTSCPATCRCRRPRATRRSTPTSSEHRPTTGFWGNTSAYIGLAAQGVVRRRGHGRERLLLRPPAAHRPATTRTTRRCSSMRDGRCNGYFVHGPEPGRGSANSKLHRLALAEPRLARGPRPRRDRDRRLLVRLAGDRVGRELRPRTSAPRSSSCPPPPTPRRTAPSPTPSGCCSGTTRRSSRRATAAPSCGSCTTWAAASARSWPPREDPRDRPVLDLTWDYPTEGPRDEPDAEAVLRRSTGYRTADRRRVIELHGAGRRRLDGVRLLDLRRRLRRRGQPDRAPQARPASRPGSRRSGAGRGRSTAASSTTAPRPTRRGSRGPSASATSGGTRRQGAGPATTSRTSRRPSTPGLRAPRRRRGPGRAARRRPVHHAGRRPGLALRALRASSTGRSRRTTSPRSRRSRTRSTAQQANPTRQQFRRAENPYNPVAGQPGAEVFPYVLTTYRLTEHHTAGGMSRTLPYLAELQPEMFCEVSPRAGGRARARARRLGHGRDHAPGHRGAGAGDRADGAR